MNHKSRLTKLEKRQPAPDEKIDEIKVIFVESSEAPAGKPFMSLCLGDKQDEQPQGTITTA